MSKIEVNQIRPQCGTTVTIGGTGETVNVSAPTITLGATGGTVALACGATQTGFGSECMSWCAAIKSTAFTAAAGKGYFINTCGGGVTVTLPATATQGDTIEFKDYKRTWGTACKEITLNTNSLKFQGVASTDAVKYSTDGQAVTIVYADATQGWLPTLTDDSEDQNTYKVQYLVVAGGGGGGWYYGAGGAGGYRTVCSKTFPVTPGTTYPIQVGGGGAGSGPNPSQGIQGEPSIFSTITSAGGGGGAGYCASGTGGPGGSGGSAGYTSNNPGGTGNTPPTDPPQGNNGGNAAPSGGGGGGGGASTAGSPGPGPAVGGAGGDGSPSTISGTNVTRAGGGGGSACGGPAGAGGAGGGGAGVLLPQTANAGTPNTGGGAGGGANGSVAGGSGIVIIRRLTSSSCSSSGTTSTCGSDTIHTFTADGTFVA